MSRLPRTVGCALALFLFAGAAGAEAPKQKGAQEPDLTSISIEDLMNIKVTSVSKTEEKLSRTAAAVFVITQAEITRSGATNIPDLLRMVPGVDVAQIDANTWAVSARGLNDEYSNELLVLVDGRNVYTPTFGGVLWAQLDLPLENIERIEVIRGPGGSIWGGNAVNGVINIITKTAGETRGAMVVVGGGNQDHGFGTVEYSSALGKSTDFRIYSKYLNQNHSPATDGTSAGDAWHNVRGGFRTDSVLSAEDRLMFQGSMFSGRDGETVDFLPSITSPGLVATRSEAGESGGFFQSVWKHTYSDRSDMTLSGSYSAYESDDVLNAFAEARKTASIDFQDHVAWGDRQDFVWGIGYQYSTSNSDGNLTVSLSPAHINTQLFSSFVQDEIAIVPDRWYLTLGAKLEHNYYTGLVAMPSARATFSLSDKNMVWAAVSKADRTPASVDTAIRANFGSTPGPGGVPVLSSLVGNPHFKNEGLIAYEVGYRATISNSASIDFAVYYNEYGSQQTVEPAAEFLETSPLPIHLVMPVTYANLMRGEAHGLEISANWKVTNRWTVSPSYDFERFHMHLSLASQDTHSVTQTEESDPHVHARLRSHVDLWQSLAWDASAYFVDRSTFQAVPSYTRLDTGLTWKWRENVSLSLVGQNLVDDRHLEFVETANDSSLVKRSGYLKATWKF